MGAPNSIRDPVQFGDFSFDPRDGTLRGTGESVRLTPITSKILIKLVENQGQLISKEELKKSGWNQEFVSDGTFHRKMNELRKAFNGNGEQYIQNVPVRGYRFLVPAIQVPLPDTATPLPAVDTNEQTRDRLRVARALALLFCGFSLVGLALMVRDGNANPRIKAWRRLTHNSKTKRGPLVITDSRIYFAEGADDRWIASAPIRGGEVDRLKPPQEVDANPRLQGLDAATGELLIVGRGSALWLWLPGRDWASRIGPPVVSDAAISPDGTTLAVAMDNQIELWPFRNADQRVRTFSVGSRGANEVIRFPIAYSPDGSAIRFSVFNIQTRLSSIWEMRIDESRPHPYPARFSSATKRSCCGSWTPDGRWFLFSSQSFDAAYADDGLWTIREKRGPLDWMFTSAPQPLQTPVALSYPTVGPDGKTVYAIASSRVGQAVAFDVGTKRLFPVAAGSNASDISPSYDRAWIAFSNAWDKTIWKAKVDGSHATQLTFPPLEAYQPHWSPDGKQVAFMGKMPGKHWLAYVMPADGGAPVPIFDEGSEQGVPTWSPDARYIVFGDRQNEVRREQMKIHLWDLRDKRLSVLPGSQGFWTARWSPTRNYIAAQSGDWHDLYLFDTGAKKWLRIAHFDNIDELNWSPDGNYLYFVGLTNKTNVRTCYRFRMTDRHTETVLNFREHPEVDIHLIGIAPDGSPIFRTPDITSEIYALDMVWP